MAIKMDDVNFSIELELTNGNVVEVSVIDNEDVELWLRPSIDKDGTKVYEGCITEDMRP